MNHKPNFDQFLKVLNQEQPDYVPFYEHLTNDPIIEEIMGYKKPHMNDSKTSKQELMKFYINYYHKMGFDCAPLEFGIRLFHLGGITKNGRTWTDHSRATISNMEEFEEYPWPSPEEAFDYDLFDAAGSVLPEGMGMASGVAGGVQEHVVSLMGLNSLSKAIRMEPKLVENLFQKIGKLIFEVDKMIIERDFVGALRMGDDMGYKHATLLNPKTVRQHVMPRQKDIADLAHKHGKPFILHSCGNLSEIIDELIDYVGIDAWHSFQDIILPVTEAKKQFGERVAILGGVDLEAVCTYEPNKLEKYCKNILEICKKGGGYAFGTGNSVPSYVPAENYKLMLEYGRKYGKY